MKTKFSLPASVVMLIMLSVAGYGMASNSDRPEVTGNIALEKQLVTNSEEPKVGREILEKIAPDNPGDIALEEAPSNASAPGSIASEDPNWIPVADSLQ